MAQGGVGFGGIANPPWYADHVARWGSDSSSTDPSQWHEMDFDFCWVESPGCEEHPPTREICRAKTEEIYNDILTDPITKLSRGDQEGWRGDLQEKAVRLTCNQICNFHKDTGRISGPWTNAFRLERGRNPYSYDQSNWSPMRFDKCWMRHPDCSSDPRIRKECSKLTRQKWRRLLDMDDFEEFSDIYKLRKNDSPEKRAFLHVTADLANFHSRNSLHKRAMGTPARLPPRQHPTYQVTTLKDGNYHVTTHLPNRVQLASERRPLPRNWVEDSADDERDYPEPELVYPPHYSWPAPRAIAPRCAIL